MKGNYAPDTFTEADVIRCLEGDHLKFKVGQRYILSQCPTHEDTHPSVQIYRDDWFVNCHASCGRYHITKAYPELRSDQRASDGYQARARPVRAPKEVRAVSHYKTFDMMDHWKSLPLIPRDHYFKSIPLDILDELGWRWDEAANSYFIPYFSRSKTTIPFSQLRHLSGERRFTFLKDAKPTLYGTWNLVPGEKIFIVEGASDAAVLEYAMVPWVAAPSAASGELLKAMAAWSTENGVTLVYAGDNDLAGEKLREALDEVAPHRVKQARSPYKDWGEMLEAEGIESVVAYTHEELFGKLADMGPPKEFELVGAREILGPPEDWHKKTPVEQVKQVMGEDCVELTIKDGGGEGKEATKTSPPPRLF